MNGRTRSFNALESPDGNWVIGPSRSQQALYDVPNNSKQKIIPNGNTSHGKSRGHLSDTRAEPTTLSKVAHESYLKRDGQRGRSDLTTRRLKTNNRRSHSVERPSTSTTSSSGYISSRENFGKLVPREVFLHRSDGEFGFTMRQIPSTMYGSKPVSAFRPTAKVPALQRLNCIDPGSLADRVGLKPGVYVVEVNNERVTCSPHQYVVHLIKSSPDVLKLKVIEGSEDIFKPPYHSTLPQRSTAGRNAVNGNSHSTYSVPRRSYDVELPNSKRSNGLPLQPLKLNSGGNQPLKITISPSYKNSNGLSSTEKRHLPTAKPIEPVVANIRLSRVADHDQVYYESGRKQKTVNARAQSRTTTSDLQRIPSFASTVTIRSEPQMHEASNLALAGETSLKNHQRVKAGSVQEERGTVHGIKRAVNWSGSSVDDINHTYDRVRPITVPFDTDEGYIRLSTNVDYVAQALEEQEQEQVDFLAMAEKARQMYLRTKSVSQTQ